MTLLFLGIAMWIIFHFLKRLAPGVRRGMDTSMGQGPAKGVIALLLVVSIVFMVLGFKQYDAPQLYDPMPGMGHLNNLLMIAAIALLGMGSSKGTLRSKLRHPMLWGVIVWSVAHLLVNGDGASVVLFGSMAAWALVQMLLINRSQPDWTPLKPGTAVGDVRLVVIATVLFLIIGFIHKALGYSPFLGTYS